MSGYTCVWGCAQVCRNVHRYEQIHMGINIYLGVHRYEWIYIGVHGSTWVHTGDTVATGFLYLPSPSGVSLEAASSTLALLKAV